MGLYERAIGEFQAVLRQDPDLPDIRIALAEALWREGRRLEAVEVCLEILEALPNSLKANLILGEIWTQGGNEEAGEEKLEAARALDPENRVAQEMMGAGVSPATRGGSHPRTRIRIRAIRARWPGRGGDGCCCWATSV